MPSKAPTHQVAATPEYQGEKSRRIGVDDARMSNGEILDADARRDLVVDEAVKDGRGHAKENDTDGRHEILVLIRGSLRNARTSAVRGRTLNVGCSLIAGGEICEGRELPEHPTSNVEHPTSNDQLRLQVTTALPLPDCCELDSLVSQRS